MSIGAAVLEILDARGVLPAEIADRMGTRNRATCYRVLNGKTADPRVSTLAEICNALMIEPDELLELAGLYGSESHRQSRVDAALWQAFSESQQLDDDDRRVCLLVLRAVTGSRAQRTDAQSGRGVPSTRGRLTAATRQQVPG
jgi:transcriptional regulator with XRE-family HTH domain